VSELAFNEDVGRQLEAAYQVRDAIRRRRLVRAALGARSGEQILDVGCGPGFYCAELLEEVGPRGRVVGLDMSPEMLVLAQRRCAAYENVEFGQAEATGLPVDDAAFDGAVCVQVLEYVRDIPAALAELHRVVRPGGRVVVWDVDWATVSWHSEHPDRMARVLRAWDEHLVHRSLPRTLASAMRAVGFERVEMEAHSFASTEFDPETYAVATMQIIRRFVPGHDGVSDDEARAWGDEQRELGERGEYYFACLQSCFTATRN